MKVLVLMCVRVCVRACTCQLLRWGLCLQCDMPVMFASRRHPEGVRVHQAAGVTGKGRVPGALGVGTEGGAGELWGAAVSGGGS